MQILTENDLGHLIRYCKTFMLCLEQLGYVNSSFQL